MRFILLAAGVTVVVLLGLMIDAQSRTPVDRPAESSQPYTIFAAGRIEGATPEIELRTRASGRIVELLIQEGQFVRKGDVLLRLDDEQHRHQVSLAAAELALAEAQLERLLNGVRPQQCAEAAALHKAKLAELERAELAWQRIDDLRQARAVSQQKADDQRMLVASLRAQVEAAKSRLELLEAPARDDEVQMDKARTQAARAQLELAKVQQERTKLRAPSDGQILKINVESGELTGSTSMAAAAVMADTSKFHVRAFVEELDAPRVRVGMTAIISADGLPDKELQGHVIRLSPRMSRKHLFSDRPTERHDVKTREVWIELDQTAALVVGLPVDVTIQPGPQVDGEGERTEPEGRESARQ